MIEVVRPLSLHRRLVDQHDVPCYANVLPTRVSQIIFESGIDGYSPSPGLAASVTGMIK